MNVNPEAVAFGFSLSTGFLGAYWTVHQLLERDIGLATSVVLIAGALFYVSCPLVAVIYWGAPYEWPLAVGGIPLLLSLSLAYLRSGTMTTLLSFSAITTISGAGIQVVPVSLPFLPVVVIVIGFAASRPHTVRFALRRVAHLAAVFAGASAYWLIPLGASIFVAGGMGSTALAAASTVKDTVQSVVIGQSLLYTFAAVPSFEFLRAFNWNTLGFIPWYRLFIVPNIAVLGMSIHYLLVSQRSPRRSFVLSLYLVLAFLLLAFFETVNLLSLGEGLFLFISGHVPGWAMFRNFYGKFAAAYMLVYSIILALGISFALAHRSRFVRVVLPCGLLILVSLQGWPLLGGNVIRLQMTGAPSGYTSVGQLSPSFWSAMSYLERRDATWRVLELPFHNPPQSIYPMQPSSAVYIGDSLVRVLSGHDVFNSIASFRSEGSIDLPGLLEDALRRRDYQTTGLILRLTGTRLVLFTSGVPPAISSHWKPTVPFPQNSEEMAALARGVSATLAASFADPSGASWDVYELPEATSLTRAFVTSSVKGFNGLAVSSGATGPTVSSSTPSPYSDLSLWLRSSLEQGQRVPDQRQRVSAEVIAVPDDSSRPAQVNRSSPWTYEVTFSITQPSTLVVLEPYSRDWTLEFRSAPGGAVPTPPMRVDGYAIGWRFSGVGTYVVLVKYRFQALLWFSLGITAVTSMTLLGVAALHALKVPRRFMIRSKGSTTQRSARH